MFEFLRPKDIISSVENLCKPSRAQLLLYYKIQPKEMKSGQVRIMLFIFVLLSVMHPCDIFSV